MKLIMWHGFNVGGCLSIGTNTPAGQYTQLNNIDALLQQPLPVDEGQMVEAGSDPDRDRCPIPLRIRLYHCADWGLSASLRRASQDDMTLGRL